MNRPLRLVLPLVLVVALTPLLKWDSRDYILQILTQLFMFVVLAQSYDILDGTMGYTNLGHITFFGLGAYSFGIFFNYQFSFLPALALGTLFVLAFAVVMSYPFFRLRGAYFALATFGLVKLMEYVTENLGGITGGSNGLKIEAANRTLPAFFLTLGLAVAVVAATWWLRRSRLGLAMMSIREDEEVARDFGVPTYLVKAQALMISAFFPAVMGGIYTWNINFIDTGQVYGLTIALTPVAMALLGGTGLVVGPVIGTFFLFGAQEILVTNVQHLHSAIFGAVIVFTGLFMPGGLARIPFVARLLETLGLLEAPR